MSTLKKILVPIVFVVTLLVAVFARSLQLLGWSLRWLAIVILRYDAKLASLFIETVENKDL